jgi:magnesium-transporting ATPase (P-type)
LRWALILQHRQLTLALLLTHLAPLLLLLHKLQVITKYGGVEERYSLLLTIPFDSARKRMSVVVRCPDGSVMLYCKGADNIILDRAVAFAGTTEERVGLQLGVFAEDGLRTLLLARRHLSSEFYTAWAEEYRLASVTVEGRQEKLAEVYTKVS